MNIYKLIEREASRENEHDNAYKQELLKAYSYLKNYSKDQLLTKQRLYRSIYDSSHRRTAILMVIYELLKEKE